MHLFNPLHVNFILFQILPRRFPFRVRIRMAKLLIDGPDFGDIVFNFFEAFMSFQVSVGLISIVDMGIALPFDVESLSWMSACRPESNARWAHQVDLRDILLVGQMIFVSRVRQDLINLITNYCCQKRQ